MAEVAELLLLEGFDVDDDDDGDDEIECYDSPLINPFFSISASSSPCSSPSSLHRSALRSGGAPAGDDEIEGYRPPPIDPFFSISASSSPSPLHRRSDLRSGHPPAGGDGHRLPETLERSSFAFLEGADDMGSDYLGLGLGFPLDAQEHPRHASNPAGSGGSAGGRLGLRVVGFGSDTGSDDDDVIAAGDPPDPASDGVAHLPLYWDCLQLEEEEEEGEVEDPQIEATPAAEEFEWEEVDGRLHDRDALSVMVGGGSGEDEDEDEDEESGSTQRTDSFDWELHEEIARRIDWEEVLWVNANGPADPPMGPRLDAESDLGYGHEDFANTLEYEVLFGQFADHDSSIRGTPPAARSVVESLPVVVVTEVHAARNNTLCAVCKDEIPLGQGARQLPCFHHYHGDCIVPWLRIRNTCPVCRYELKTDDPEYENRRARQANAGRGGGGGSAESSLVRYDFDMLPEAHVR